jgi:hypothetical protein
MAYGTPEKTEETELVELGLFVGCMSATNGCLLHYEVWIGCDMIYAHRTQSIPNSVADIH